MVLFPGTKFLFPLHIYFRKAVGTYLQKFYCSIKFSQNNEFKNFQEGSNRYTTYKSMGPPCSKFWLSPLRNTEREEIHAQR